MAYNRYEYQTSPRKIKLEYETIEKRYPKKSTAGQVSKKRTQKSNKLTQMKIISYVAIGFIALFVISYRYSIIDETYSDLKGLKAELGMIEKENAQLEANLESTLSLTSIEQEAQELLGMQKLSSEQIVYVTLPKTDYVETSLKQINNYEKNSNWLIEIINKIIETLSTIEKGDST